MVRTTLWNRIGGWLRSSGRTGEARGRGPAPENDSLAIDEEPGGNDGAGPLVRPERAPGVFPRWARRDQALQRLQKGYERLAETIDSVQVYLAAQERRGQQLEGSLKRLVEAADAVSAQSGRTLELLEQVVHNLQSAGKRDDRLMELLSGLPEATRRQTDALDAVGRRLELVSETDAQIADSLQTVGRAVDQWDQSVGRQNDLIAGLGRSIERNDERLNAVFVRQGRWIWILGIALVVAAVAVVVAVATLAT